MAPARRKQFKRVKKSKLGLVTAVLLLALTACYLVVLEESRPHVSGDRLRIDTFMSLAAKGQIRSVRILDEDAYVVGEYVVVPDGADTTPASIPPLVSHSGGGELRPAVTTIPLPEGKVRPYNSPLVRTLQPGIVSFLVERGVPTDVDQQVAKRVMGLAAVLLPSLIIVVLWVYFLLSWRRSTGVFSGRSQSRRVDREDTPGVTFADVAGQAGPIAELEEVRDYLADPARYRAIGAPIPRGILLYGPPGCGKTLLARALAGEANAAFFSISGSDFVELYAGVGAARVRDLFREARESAPAIVFIDEIDSIGRSRAESTASRHGEQEQALNQILTEMDGFATFDGVVVVGATNRPDILDPALLRPGRFDRDVALERPDETARLAILAIHARNKRLAADVDLGVIASRSYGLTGADLANVMNEGALLAVRAEKTRVSQEELLAALGRIMAAPDRQRRLSLRSRSVARRPPPDERITFADIAGVDEVLAELREVADYLARPDRYASMGARIPRGVLLVGPPGCGKTLLARAIAGEANAAFFNVSSTEFVEMFVGVGAARVRDLFAEASSVAPSIVFIDEIDSIGASRSSAGLDGHREREQTLNQILVELDGFQARSAVVVIGATNRPDILDTALTRPGRFDRRIAVSLPDRPGRRAIMAVHAKGKPFAPDVDFDTLAGLTRGFSGADLANVVNEAAMMAVRAGHPRITSADLEEGIDRALLGIARGGAVMSEEERLVVAYHEAGHAIVALALPGASPPHKITLVSRGGTLGHCANIDSIDRLIHSRSRLIDRMAVSLGGLVAEELVWGEWTSGAGGDLENVGRVARQMVAAYGMSEAAGTIAYPSSDSERTGEVAHLIDAEARRLSAEARQRAQTVLGQCRPVLDRMARALLDRETLTEADLRQLCGDDRNTAETRHKDPVAELTGGDPGRGTHDLIGGSTGPSPAPSSRWVLTAELGGERSRT